MKYYLIIPILFLFSCTKDGIDNHSKKVTDVEAKVEWDYLNNSFRNLYNQQNLEMLCGYDVFELKRIKDSLFEIKLAEFQGWKKDSKNYDDTLKLTENKKVFDSAGNQKKQILKFSNKNKVDLEVVIHKTGLLPDSIYTYEFSGKIKIDNHKLKYSCDELWVK